MAPKNSFWLVFGQRFVKKVNKKSLFGQKISLKGRKGHTRSRKNHIKWRKLLQTGNLLPKIVLSRQYFLLKSPLLAQNLSKRVKILLKMPFLAKNFSN